LINRREVFAGQVLRLVVDRVSLPGGSISTREVVYHPGAVAIIPFLTDRKIVLVKQYRHAVGKLLWEIPAGKLEQTEKPLDCAKRELFEETGYRARRWTRILSFYTSPGFTDEQITLFVAKELIQAGTFDTREIGLVSIISQSQIEQMVNAERIRDGKTLLALFCVGMLPATSPS